MTNFDAYTLKARISPALLVFLPLVAVLLAWFPALASLPGLSAMAACATAGGLILAFQVRHGGRELEARLFSRWGAPPTTRLLRHRDDVLSAVDKARYHATLQALVRGITMPTAQGEQADPTAADQIYTTATAWLRERTRDSSKFPVIANENASYGFHRNLCALRATGLIAASVGAIGSLGLLADSFRLPAIAALAVSAACGMVFWFHATEDRAHQAAMRYAVALIRATDALEK